MRINMMFAIPSSVIGEGLQATVIHELGFDAEYSGAVLRVTLPEKVTLDEAQRRIRKLHLRVLRRFS